MQQDCRDFPQESQGVTTRFSYGYRNKFKCVVLDPVHNSNSCADKVHVPEKDEKEKRKRDKRKKKRLRSRSSSSSDSESEHDHPRRKDRTSKRKIPFEQNSNFLPPPYNPYMHQLEAGRYQPYVVGSTTPSDFYQLQTPFNFIPFNPRFHQQCSLVHQNIQDNTCFPVAGYPMPMNTIQAFNHQNTPLDASTHLEDQEDSTDSTALGILADAATFSSNK